MQDRFKGTAASEFSLYPLWSPRKKGIGKREKKGEGCQSGDSRDKFSQQLSAHALTSISPNPPLVVRGRVSTFREVEVGVSLQEEGTHSMYNDDDDDHLDPRGGVGEGSC